jgi:fructokinase
LNPSDSPRIGIDLGGTKIEGILLDPSGDIRVRQRVQTPQEDYQAILATIKKLVESFPGHQGLPVGIGTPGSVSRVSPMMRNSNSVCLNNKPLLADLNAMLGRPVRLANDANCFALSEASDGAAAKENSAQENVAKEKTVNEHIVFGVILGTGVGGGLCINGKVLEGINGIAGEWGHNPLPNTALQLASEHHLQTTRSCFCGAENCIETWLSGPALISTYREISQLKGSQNQSADSFINGEMIDELARDDDHNANQALELYTAQLSIALATVINIIDPSHIVFGGGLSNIERLYTDLPEHLAQWVFSDHLDTRIIQAKHGDSSGVRGAAWLWP